MVGSLFPLFLNIDGISERTELDSIYTKIRIQYGITTRSTL